MTPNDFANPPHWQLLDSPDAVAEAASSRILQQADRTIAERGAFHIVLAGGSTPARCYQLLARSPGDWSNWHIWFGDERCLPADHPERNSRMARQNLLSQVPIPASQIHPIPAELGPEAAAARYRSLIEPILPFDTVLLGMGEDGHTASLFPGQRQPADALVVPVHGAPKPPSDRVSLGRSALGRCRQLLFLVSGAGKQKAVAAWLAGDPLPVALIQSEGNSEVLLDQAALGLAMLPHTK